MHLAASLRVSALLLGMITGLCACKGASGNDGVTAAAEQGAASATAAATATPTATVVALTPVLPATVQPVVLGTSVAKPPASVATPAPTGTPGAPGTGQPPAHKCPALACARPAGCLEMAHDSAGCPTCNCAKGGKLPPLGGPPQKP